MSGRPESDLVQALLRREDGAWREFLDLYGGVLVRSIRRVLGNSTPPDQVDDLVGEIVSRLLEADGRRLRAFRGDSALSTWLWHLARGAALDHLDRLRRRPSATGRLEDLAVPEPDPALLEETERIREALERLPERSRKALRMSVWEERAYTEIAAALGVAPEGVGSLLARAKAELSGILGRNALSQPTKPL